MSIQDLITRYERINNFADNVSLSKVIEDLNELMESRKPVVPQFVADWIEECKNDDFYLFGAMEEMSIHQKKLDYWFREDDNMELFARAWLDGYTVEEEHKYNVKFKGISGELNYLNYNSEIQKWYFSSNSEIGMVRTKFTRKELEYAGFGEVFNSPLFEVDEVE